jgi:hypothetical protein
MEAVAYLLIVAGIALAVWAAVRSEAGDSQSTIDNRKSPMASDTAKAEMSGLTDLGRTESLTYRPAAGGSRAISGVVERKTPEPYGRAAAAAVIQITVLNDATYGIDDGELTLGSDRIDVAERVGGAAAARSIHRLVGEECDEDFLKIEVR